MILQRQKFRTSHAFTLVETTTVLLIISILAAVAMPGYSLALARYRLAVTQQRILADLSLAQAVAKTSSAGQTVLFDTINNNYKLTNYAGPLGGTAQSTYTVSLATDPYDATIVSASFNSTAQLSYDRFGQPTAGGTIVVQVGSYQKTITVSSSTGKATGS